MAAGLSLPAANLDRFARAASTPRWCAASRDVSSRTASRRTAGSPTRSSASLPRGCCAFRDRGAKAFPSRRSMALYIDDARVVGTLHLEAAAAARRIRCALRCDGVQFLRPRGRAARTGKVAFPSQYRLAWSTNTAGGAPAASVVDHLSRRRPETASGIARFPASTGSHSRWLLKQDNYASSTRTSRSVWAPSGAF